MWSVPHKYDTGIYSKYSKNPVFMQILILALCMQFYNNSLLGPSLRTIFGPSRAPPITFVHDHFLNNFQLN